MKVIRLPHEDHAGDPWATLVCALVLQRGVTPQAVAAMNAVLERWPTWTKCRDALGVHYDHAGNVEVKNDDEWKRLFLALDVAGYGYRRTQTLLRWLMIFHVEGMPKTRTDVAVLPNAGEYIKDCWALFMERRYDREPDDVHLKGYWEKNRGA